MARAYSNRPYTLLARFYDELSDYAPGMNRYARRRTLGKILPQVRVVCELGCGTGTTALDFARRGLKVFAVDNSATMCHLARQKARRAGLSVPVLCADMKSFRLPEPVDLVTCEFGTLNHMSRKTDITRVMRAVARALWPGGYFYFDVNTPRTFEQLPKLTEWTEKRDFCMLLRVSYGRRRQKARLEIDWFLPAGKLWRRQREYVANICWTDGEIRRALRRAGFRRIRVWDGAQVRPPACGSRPGYDTYYLAQKSKTTRRER